MQAIMKHYGDQLDYTPGGAISAGDVVLIGSALVTVANLDIAASALGAVASRGVFTVVKDDTDVTAGQPAYWDADGNPYGGEAGTGAFTNDSALGPFAGWFLEAAGTTTGTVLMFLDSRDATVVLARSALVQQDLQPYPITFDAYRVWDAPQTVIPGTPANDDLGLIDNTFGAAAPTIETGDVKTTTVTRKTRFQFAVPVEYVAGQTITARINAGMKTTISDGTATVDVECVRQAAADTDICATAAQSINNLVAADKDFTITPTDVVPGDILDVVLSVAIADTATGTAVIGQINTVELLLDVKG